MPGDASQRAGEAVSKTIFRKVGPHTYKAVGASVRSHGMVFGCGSRAYGYLWVWRAVKPGAYIEPRAGCGIEIGFLAANAAVPEYAQPAPQSERIEATQ